MDQILTHTKFTRTAADLKVVKEPISRSPHMYCKAHIHQVLRSVSVIRSVIPKISLRNPFSMV